MTHYNLKPGLRKFRNRGKAAEVKELTQLHIMDMRTLMEARKLSQDQCMRALLLLLFLKKETNAKDRHVSMVHHNGHTPQKRM